MSKKLTELYKKVEQSTENFFLKNPDILESITGFKIIKSDLERPVMERRVDIVNGTSEKTVVLTEISVRCNTQKDYNDHLSQILKTIEIVGKVKYASIILIAPNFRDEDISKIQMMVMDSNLSVNLIWLPSSFLSIVQEYVSDGQNIKQILDNLNKVDYKWQYVTLNSNVIDITNPFVIFFDKEESGIKIIKDILLKLRDRMDNIFTVLKYKCLDKNKISIGTGTEDIMLNVYFIKKEGKEDIIKIQLYFAKRENICMKFKNNISKMVVFIGYPVETIGKRNEIVSIVKISAIDKITVDLVANITEKYLLYIHEMYKNIDA